MNIAVHQRPGVYSSYDASSVVSGSGAGRLVGIVAVNTKATAGVAQTVTTYDQAVTAFGSGGEEDLAEMLGVSNAAVAMWESGKNRISTGYLERLADIFGVTTDYILGRDSA